MAQPVFSIASDSFPSELEITAIEGTESISNFFDLNISFKVAKDIAASMDHSILTSEDVYLTVDAIEDREEAYQIKGVFSKVEEVFEHSNTHKFYTANLVPALWRKRNNQSYDIFTHLNAHDILSDELNNDLMLDHHLALTAEYPIKEFVCQYSESNFNFVSRLAEHWGMYYYFDHDEGGRLVFADDTNYEELEISPLKLDESNNPTNSFNTIRTMHRVFNAVPDSVIITETNPDQAMELYQGLAGETEDGKSSVNMADEGCDNKDEAEFIAKVRLEEFQANKTIYSGTTGIPCITPGFFIAVETPSGEIHEILITEVSHSGGNLDQGAKAGGTGVSPFYECTFKGIPKETQFRPERKIEMPNVISTTGRVYSAADDQTLAQRNEVGKYQVTFDFMRGEEDKISNWIRHASHTARSNHFDMPLTPGTEVQIGFIAGNPNRPYIMHALENSQSVIHPVTHDNPHHATMITDGMLYTGALKSRQSLHMTANLDPATVRDHVNNNALKNLGKDGLDSGNPVDLIKGDVHINRTYGERYQWREGVDFNFGLNATFNFGQQYVENHSDEKLAAGAEVFDLPGIDSRESSNAGSVDEAIQSGLAEERKAGLVTKNFGNQYIYDQGITRTWAAGPDACREHVTINFGGRYIENQLQKQSGDQDTSGLNGIVSDTTLAIKTVGDEARYNEGVIDIHHEGDMKHIQTGSHTSEITGDVTETITGNVTKDITGDVAETITGGKYELTQTLSGDSNQIIMAGGKMTIQATAATEISSIEITPSKKATLSGNEDWVKTAMKSELVFGIVNENFIGGKFSTIGGLITENALGAKIATHSGPIMENKQGQMGKNQLSIQDIKSVCMDKSLTKIQKASLILIG